MIILFIYTISFIYLLGYLATLAMEIKINISSLHFKHEVADFLLSMMICVFWPLVLGDNLAQMFIDIKKNK